MDSVKTNRDYLVKSANVVIGPFTLPELVELICTKKIASFDEVQGPKRVWRLIKEDPVLKTVLEEAAHLMEQSEATMDVTHTIDMATKSISKIGEDFSDDEPSFDEYRRGVKEIKAIDKVVKKKKGRKASYSKTSKNSLVYFLLLFVAAASFYSLSVSEHRVETTPSTSMSLDDLAYIGKFAEVSKNIDAMQSPDFSMKLKKIDALMQIKKYLLAEREIESLLKSERQSDVLARLNNWLGLIYLQRQDFNKAKKHFEQSLLLFPTYEVAKLNLADTYLLLDDVNQAKANLLLDVTTENASSTNTFLKFETAYFLHEPLVKETEMYSELMNFRNIVMDQKQELLFFSALVLLENNFLEEAKELFREAFSIYPDFYRNNLQSSDLYHPQVVLQKLIILYKRQEFKYANNPYYQATLAILYHKSGSALAFREHLDKAIALDAGEPYIQALSTYINFRYDYNSMIKRIASGTISPLEASFIGNYCERANDFQCERVIWDYLIVLNPNSLQATAGYIREFLRQNKNNEAMGLVQKGLGLAPRYLPIRELEMRLKYE